MTVILSQEQRLCIYYLYVAQSVEALMQESRFLVLKAADAEGNYSLWMSLGPLTLRVMGTPVSADTRRPPNIGVMLARRRSR